MPITPPVDFRYMVTISCSDDGKFDPNGMRKNMRDVLGRAATDGTLLADDTPYLGPTAVQYAARPEDMILAMMSETINTGPAARQVIQECLNLLRRNHTRGARQILTAADRETLIKGIVLTRKKYEELGEARWVGDVVRNGYPGWESSPDELLLVDAFLDHSCLHYLANDEHAMAVLRILARSDFLNTLFPHGVSSAICEELEADLDLVLSGLTQTCASGVEAVDLRDRIVFAVAAMNTETSGADAPGA